MGNFTGKISNSFAHVLRMRMQSVAGLLSLIEACEGGYARSQSRSH